MPKNPKMQTNHWCAICAECGTKWDITSISPQTKTKALGIRLGNYLRKKGWFVADEDSLCSKCQKK